MQCLMCKRFIFIISTLNGQNCIYTAFIRPTYEMELHKNNIIEQCLNATPTAQCK